MSRIRSITLLCTFLSFGACATDPGDRALGVIPAGSHTLTGLVDEFARVAKATILIEELQRTGDGTLQLQSPLVLTNQDFVETLHNLLFTRQFAVVPVDSSARIFDVVSLQGPRRDLAMTTAIQRDPAAIRAQPESMRFVWCEVPLEIHNAATIVNALRPMLAQGAFASLGMVATPDDRGVLVRGPQALVASAIELVERTNRPRTGQ